MRFRTLLTGTALAAMTGFTAPAATALELIANGGFETGTFGGWTVFDQAGGSGSFFIDDNDGFTPLSGLPTVGPANGSFYAVSDQTGPGAHALLQSFTVPIGTTSIVLTFDMFINDLGGGPIIDPAGLDYTVSPNQHARVDILTAGAGPLSTAPADIVSNVFLGSDTSGPNPYTGFNVDLTGSLTPGSTYQLRFAEVDNQGFFNQGVDNVSIEAQAVPVPLSAAFLGVGLAGLAVARRWVAA